MEQNLGSFVPKAWRWLFLVGSSVWMRTKNMGPHCAHDLGFSQWGRKAPESVGSSLSGPLLPCSLTFPSALPQRR